MTFIESRCKCQGKAQEIFEVKELKEYDVVNDEHKGYKRDILVE